MNFCFSDPLFFYQRNLKLCYVFCSFFEFLLPIHVTMCHEVVYKIRHLSAFFNHYQNPLLISLYYMSFTTCHISSGDIFCENYCEL